MKPPLLLIPGAFCGGWAFDELGPLLEAAGYPVRALDLPGHGPGGSVVGRSLADYTRAVAEAADACDQPPVLIGHSMGGLVAQIAAGKSRVAALALLAPSPAWGQAVTSAVELASAFALPTFRGAYWLEAITPDWATVREYTLDRLPLAEARAVHARMGPESGRALFEVLNWWLDPGMTAAAPPLQLPALVMTGENDRVHPAATTGATAARLGARHLVLPEMSHWTLSGPGVPAVGAALLEFLTGL